MSTRQPCRCIEDSLLLLVESSQGTPSLPVMASCVIACEEVCGYGKPEPSGKPSSLQVVVSCIINPVQACGQGRSDLPLDVAHVLQLV